MDNFINTSKAIAIMSFLIGTILFAIQLFFMPSDGFIFLGIIFIIVAAIINTISLLGLVFFMLGYSTRRLKLLKTCGMILLNIPIAILYFFILIEFL